MNILLFRQTRILPDEISFAVLDHILRQTLKRLLLSHPLNDLSDKGGETFQGFREHLCIPVNIL